MLEEIELSLGRLERVPSTDQTAGYEAVLDGPELLFSKSQKYGVRMANFLPALPLCDRWKMVAEILVDETTEETRQLELDHTDGLDSHYSANDQFDSDVKRTLARKWERATTEWELVREDDVFDLGAEVMFPDFAIEYPDGRRAILEIVGFWTPEYLDAKLEKIREVEADNFVLAVSERVEARGNSPLVVSQVTGDWLFEEPHLSKLCLRVRELSEEFETFEIVYIERVAFTPVYRKFVDEREPLFTSTIPVHRAVTGVCGPPARAHTRSSRGFSGVQSLDLDEPIALEGARIQADLRAAGTNWRPEIY